ncbi:CYTH and CHAD domain-containing protein [Aquabacterium sp.]|uniref:CYTH and CHAD domain-containing protein n=1 Tax=Aquabacterium sp. TaxID=1872578 RepID=UPI00262063D6|nr:CYTH and CHAD domain-containing protein [Aquabacterium sp.]MDD2977876.1 CYTH and CHAD domain-containing protein [Aquabacterium sp.]
MQEIELKFQIPALALSAVQAELTALDGGHHAPLRLRAAYFDTPERALAHAHMALRVRQEGRRWVQTLKAGGSNTMMRLEDNQPAKAPKARQAVVADLARHLGTPAETALRTVLGWDPAQDPSGAATGLIELYRTDITRHRARVTVGAGTPYEGVVELALDLGHIHAGELNVTVRELEIESISGHPMAVIEASRDWVRRHGVWLDTQTKAHRGDRLARLASQASAASDTASPEAEAEAEAEAEHATLARPARLQADSTLDQAWRAALESCLEQISANMSELGTAPAVLQRTGYQWRLGLRRLRVLARLLQPTSLPFPHAALVHADALYAQLGLWRDAQALAWLPAKIVRKGGPDLPLPYPDMSATHDEAVIALARSATATTLCLDLLAALLHPPGDNAEAQQPYRPWLVKRLGAWRTRCREAARHAGKLSEVELHTLRKRAKRLRLMADLFAPAWKPKRHQAHGRALKAALDAMGRIQDEAVAESWYAQAAADDARARWAQDWLHGRRRKLRRQANRALHDWRDVKAPW